MTEPTPLATESQLTADDLASAIRQCPSAHINLRANLIGTNPHLSDMPPLTHDKAALSMIRMHEPVDRHSVARFLVGLRGLSQVEAFALIKKLIKDGSVIECDGELMIPQEEVRPCERSPLLWRILLGLTIAAVIAAVVML